MKIFEVKNKAAVAKFGEHILGFKETGSHACYMIYGILKPGEKDRMIKPGKGHEEILLAMLGDIDATGFYTGKLAEGTALHITGDNECFLENNGKADAVYIICGGHSESGHH